MINSTNFNALVDKENLFMIRYSHQPHPDFIKIQFVEIKHNNIIIIIPTPKGNVKKVITPLKALHRVFKNKDEMVKSLEQCFIKRNINTTPIQDLISTSITNIPELWI